MWRDARRRMAAVLMLAMLGFTSLVNGAEASAASDEWRVSSDYGRIEIDGQEYENTTMLVKLSPAEYLFINPWAEYLADPRTRASRSPEAQHEVVIQVVTATLTSLALQFPDVELILLGNRPWQEHPLGEHYLNALPEEYRELAADPALRGYMAEVIREEVTASYARLAPRNEVMVIGEAYHFYRSPADVQLAGEVLAPEAREYLRIPYREFIAQIGGDWPVAWDSRAQPTKQVEVVLYLDRADLTVYENRGTPEEKSEVRWLDQPAVAPEGHTLIPARAVFEAFGATVTWLEETRQVLVETPDKRVLLTLGSNMALVSTKRPNPVAEYLPMKAPAQLLNNRTVIPLRFVAESLGYEVEWSDPDRRITVRAAVLN
ncbi:stalk domain-containing protein [Symbiobacterium terraclitae]|uniref:stalk domain-containing protein n=1 Tax=Symbiobacterium terraclitae TaxID=557451 RepID=UPI0035B568FA